MVSILSSGLIASAREGRVELPFSTTVNADTFVREKINNVQPDRPTNICVSSFDTRK